MKKRLKIYKTPEEVKNSKKNFITEFVFRNYY